MDRFGQDMTSSLFGNPHSASASSQFSTARIEDIRLRVLQFFNADPVDFDLVFVANATAGIKLVADALRACPGGFDYVYHQASHTSLVGVREEARNSRCLDSQQVGEWLEERSPLSDDGEASPVLFAYPAQSNMDGRRFPLSWAARLRCRGPTKAYTLLDAAALVCSSPLDLSDVDAAPDFTVLSFYKIFGFPDLGALIVRRGAEDVFSPRRYFGGGTVDMVVCLKEQWHAPKSQFLHERLEHGTLPVHSIVALDAALDVYRQLFGSMQDVAAHTSFLSRRLYRGLKSLRHGNGQAVCLLYSPDPEATDSSLGSGPVIAFNIRNSVGAWVSLAEVEKLATLKCFHVRTGGVCNPGGIAAALGLEPWEMMQNFSSGFRCGAENDIMAGKPTGVIRASLGAMSTVSDVDSFVGFVAEFYRDISPAPQASGAATQSHPPSQLHIHSISIFPIKSCARFDVPPGTDWEVKPEGLAWDREWCLVHAGTGQVLSQKRHPKMALVRPSLDLEQGQLRVTYAGEVSPQLPREISIPLSKNPSLFHPPAARARSSRVCGDEIQAQTYSCANTNHFFSAVLGVPCLLARFPAGGQGKSMRHSKAQLQKHQLPHQPAERNALHMPGSFPAAPPSPPDSGSERCPIPRRILLSNESPILAITLPSLDALNDEIRRASPGGSGSEVSSGVFRANIVMGPAPSSNTTALTPYAEDAWSGVKIGRHGWEFDMLGACRRCHMVCINQETAAKSEEPFVTLSKTRRFDGKVFFGVHMGVGGGGGGGGAGGSRPGGAVVTVRVGDGVVPVWRE
ncbi:PLP-dependent transferase [Trichocladium antarcticum]|uniref:Molybdenum cofactor sulfurase n=1 Tax=Trichocladium antarcticum TaxID=1450529 RepID=A0AAN6ZFE8_9PEZI|nr:PLP-dependent transferase [Trichocladium antarcticum]